MHSYEDYVKILNGYESLYISRKWSDSTLYLETLYNMIDLYVEIVDHNFSDLAQRIEDWLFFYSHIQALNYILDKKDARLDPLESILMFRLYA